MQIKITQKHKSINPPCDFEFPDFSVLTGKNGSGKTHLLEAIADNQKSQVLINGNIVRNIRYIGFNGLNPNIQETCDPQTIIQHIKNTWTNYHQAIQNNSNQRHQQQNNDINMMLRFVGDENMKRFITNTVEVTGKLFDQLTEDDFADNFDISFMGQNDFFTAQFALIFKNYHKRQEENSINEYYLIIADLGEEKFELKYIGNLFGSQQNRRRCTINFHAGDSIFVRLRNGKDPEWEGYIGKK